MNLFRIKRACSLKAALSFSLVIFFALLTGCGLIPEKNIYTEIEIDASSETVWSILIDNKAYPEWNPYHVRVEGDMALDHKLEVDIEKPNGNNLTIHPTLWVAEPYSELTWGGGITGIFIGRHSFVLSEIDQGKTRLVHKEHFSGFAIPFAELDTIEEGYQLMNEALKRRAEALEGAHL
ncbi:SRPBCC family protein [Neptuniibacter sp. QD29_5]|uniref:SRPBCC family protein n=1 Tax=Neptuniibacter sp. QD29_5 TaxID=3398207 RepID=UPI0039F5188B